MMWISHKAAPLISRLIANCCRQPHSRPKAPMHQYPTSKTRLQRCPASNRFFFGRHRKGSVMFIYGIVARAIRLLLESRSSIAPIAATKGVPIVARKRFESSKAPEFLNRRPYGDSTTVRMTFATVFEWWFLVQAVKEMNDSTMPSCLPYRDEG
ncbi:hypothetical protein N431DRAFT_338488 [Stipitochalara longipes BDJ]|nr:hypothetical protein N431DRAFT_338488 [Stipitochalara longipes BDJ]